MLAKKQRKYSIVEYHLNFHGIYKKLPEENLKYLKVLKFWWIYVYHRTIILRNYRKTGRDNIVYVLIINGVFALNGVEEMLTTLK